jgi:phosphoribosyl 1,2-cyclic phosphodiesterase
MRITVLGSGSGGNCTLVESGSTALLIDAGFSCRQITQRLATAGRTLDTIDAVLISHEHSDHISALPVLCKSRQIPIYANRLTAEAVNYETAATGTRVPWRLFSNGSAFTIGDLTINPFTIPHDAQDPVAFVIHNSTVAAGFVTDLGHATQLVTERIRGLHALVLESNHDVKLLQDDPIRPWALKQRILSRHGHLSNDAAGQLAAEIVTDKLQHLVLAHLSRDCNRPELAHKAATNHLRTTGASHVQVQTAHQHEPLPPIQL